jgi:hypothetical protein
MTVASIYMLKFFQRRRKENAWGKHWFQMASKMKRSQDHWVRGLCLSSGILNKYKAQRFGNWMFPSSGEGRERHTLLGPLERARLDYTLWSSDWGKQQSRRLSPLAWRRKQIQFPKKIFFYLEFRTMNKVHKPSDSECYTRTPTSEPFVFYRVVLRYS